MKNAKVCLMGKFSMLEIYDIMGARVSISRNWAGTDSWVSFQSLGPVHSKIADTYRSNSQTV